VYGFHLAALAEALLDGLPRPVESLRDLRPRSALRASLLDRSALNVLQDIQEGHAESLSACRQAAAPAGSGVSSDV
jgi:hypothetical protein